MGKVIPKNSFQRMEDLLLKSHYVLNDFEGSRKEVTVIALKIFINILYYMAPILQDSSQGV